ncbi:unnamed protein product [Boreogadus saida]
MDRRLRLETRGLQHRTRGVGLQHPPLLLINMDCAVLRSVGNLSVTHNVFLERRRAGRGAVNLEDDHQSTNEDYQESAGLMEKPYIWKGNPEDHQDSTIKDSSHT